MPKIYFLRMTINPVPRELAEKLRDLEKKKEKEETDRDLQKRWRFDYVNVYMRLISLGLWGSIPTTTTRSQRLHIHL